MAAELGRAHAPETFVRLLLDTCAFIYLATGGVMRPEAVEYAIQEFERQLQAALSELTHQVGRMRERSEQLQGELRNLVAMTATCGPAPSLIEGINQREQELKTITRQLLASEGASVTNQVGKVRQPVTERLCDIRGLLTADV